MNKKLIVFLAQLILIACIGLSIGVLLRGCVSGAL